MRIQQGRFKAFELNDPPFAKTTKNKSENFSNASKQLGYRPTTSKNKEMLINMMQNYLNPDDNLALLDLYAGSGAVGFEFASWGFSQVYFVENSGILVKELKHNIKKLESSYPDLYPHSISFKVLKTKVEQLKAEDFTNQFDLIFLDPPYEISQDFLTQDINKIVDDYNLLKSNGYLILEQSKRSPDLQLSQKLKSVKNKIVGDTKFTLYQN